MWQLRGAHINMRSDNRGLSVKQVRPGNAGPTLATGSSPSANVGGIVGPIDGGGMDGPIEGSKDGPLVGPASVEKCSAVSSLPGRGPSESCKLGLG